MNPVEPLNLVFERVASIDSDCAHLDIVGTNSPLLLAPLVGKWPGPLSRRTHLIVFPTDQAASQFCEDLLFFDPSGAHHVAMLPTFDVSPYSALYPKREIASQRISWFHKAYTAQAGETFVTSVEALLQKCIPVSVMTSHMRSLSVGDELSEEIHRELNHLGYHSAPLVEDLGHYSLRGSIFDIYSPAHPLPLRLELYGDLIESIRCFDPQSQRSKEVVDSLILLPVKEALYLDDDRTHLVERIQGDFLRRNVLEEGSKPFLFHFIQGQDFPEIDFFLPLIYEELSQPLDFFQKPLSIWWIDPIEIHKKADQFLKTLKEEEQRTQNQPISPNLNSLFINMEQLRQNLSQQTINLSRIHIHQEGEVGQTRNYSTSNIAEFSKLNKDHELLSPEGALRIKEWREAGYQIFISSHTVSQAQRMRLAFERYHLHSKIVEDYQWFQWREDQSRHPDLVHIVPRPLSESLRLSEERLIFLRIEDFVGRRERRFSTPSGTSYKEVQSLRFGELKPSDYIVHVDHGIGIYEGLKVITVENVPAEFIQLKYKDGDRLYLPVYRVSQLQRYSGPHLPHLLDKLGSNHWQKTKIKVRNHLRDLASELLSLYAKRSQIQRPRFSSVSDDFVKFENGFPYDETDDQLRAISDILKGLAESDSPMDRLICGDVGFGKTEVAMRAAFKAVEDGFQVACLAPTTVLTFQHLRTFENRFRDWPTRVTALNRFVSPPEIRKRLQMIKAGEIDIVIGTHRLLSKDVAFKNLGLLIVDEEHKFGVKHKEKIRQLKAAIDTLTLSATPIPRTLNMSLVGIRDLSLINTPPVDRLPTRTFLCRFDGETIRKAIQAEVQRGGQVYFLHNRVQTIERVASEIQQLIPELRIKIGHGQMDEDQLEKTMLSFFNHDIDVLVCTTIIESGMDVPLANTMFINDAHTFGLSQLYQLRGRVGRSKQRAYCYLIVPNHKNLDAHAQERLKIIQENTALGSGIQIAHYDLELRGAGNILGDEQSGHIEAVGYDLYLDLLEHELSTLKGEAPGVEELEPEINVRIPALIPDNYISDIRLRLTFYKKMSEISSLEVMETLEESLRDQFGPLPEPVSNLMGLMLVRQQCKTLGIRDLSSAMKTISLAFTDRTPLTPEKVIRLTSQTNKKYTLTPDSRLIVRMNTIAWPNIHEELTYLISL